jgi:hypothetical protein
MGTNPRKSVPSEWLLERGGGHGMERAEPGPACPIGCSQVRAGYLKVPTRTQHTSSSPG